MRRILLYFSLKYQGDYSQIFQAIQNKEKVDPSDLEQIEQRIQCNYLTLLDKDYPESLKHIYNPPWVIYYYGDLSLLNTKMVAMIGTRQASEYGKRMCEKIVAESKSYPYSIVSGLAYGIDSIAHQQAINHQIKTIAVLGSGIDYCYPKAHLQLYEAIKEKGLILSEYPNRLPPQKNYFLVRNRLIAALSEQVVVIEANYKSGTMNTVAYALEYGKDICCVPHMANQKSGCNLLIKQGAKLVECAKDIFENNL